MNFIKKYKAFESIQFDNKRSREKAENIRDEIVEIFYDLEDIGFEIYVQLNTNFTSSGNSCEYIYQVRILNDNSSRRYQNQGLFRYSEVDEVIDRFVEYMTPITSLLPSYKLNYPITFQIDHKWSLRDRLKHNLSYDDMKKLLNEEDRASSHWSDTGHVVPKLGDNLKSIYIEATVKL